MSARSPARLPVRLRHAVPWLDAAHAATVTLLPAVAVAAFAGRRVLGGRFAEGRLWWGWLTLYAPFLVPVLMQGAIGRGWSEAAALAGFVAFVAMLSLVARLPQRGILVGGGVAIVLLAAAVSAERWHGARSWYALEAGAVQTLWIGVAGGVERVHGGGFDRAARTWALRGEPHALEGFITIRLGVPSAPGTGATERAGSPSVAELHLFWPDGDRTRRAVVALDPGDAWSDVPFHLEDPTLRATPFVQVRLAVPDGQAVDVRALIVRAIGDPGAVARPLTTRPRAMLWFEHFNTLGHVAVSMALVVTSIAARRRAHVPYLLVLGGALVIGMATGSRAATLAMMLGVALHGVARLAARESIGRRGRGWLMSVSVGLLVAGAALAVTFVARPDGGFGPSRASIWAVAARGMAEHPLAGHPEPFAVGFARAYPAWGADAATHAHNLWLDLGYRYGVPGFVAALVLVLGVAHRAWRGGRWYGLAIVVPVAALQLVDVTIWHAGALMTLALGVNLEWGSVVGCESAPERSGPESMTGRAALPGREGGG